MRMIRRATAALLLGAAVVAALAPGASAHPAKAVYTITGTAAADATAAGVSIQVTSASKNALRVLDVGDAFTASANARTRWVVVSGLTPAHATADDIDAGDRVTVTLRAVKRASLADLAAAPATRISDITARVRPDGRPYWYLADVTGVDTAAKTLSVTVKDGNLWGLRSMLGAPIAETFAYDDTTVFVKGGPHGPSLISAGSIGAGDLVTVRAWAAPWTPVATLATSPVAHVRLVRDVA